MNPRAEVYWRSRNGRSDENANLRVLVLPSEHGTPPASLLAPASNALESSAMSSTRSAPFSVGSDGSLGPEETVFQMTAGHPDGFAFDDAGNIVVASIALAPGEDSDIQTWTLEGHLLDVCRPGSSRYYTNVALGADRTLLITDSDGGRVLAVDNWPHAGLALHPFRELEAQAHG